MLIRWSVFTIVILLSGTLAPFAAAQPDILGGIGFDYPDGTHVWINAIAVPPFPALTFKEWPIGNAGSGPFNNTIHRVVWDANGFYFGYDLTIQRHENKQQYRVSFSPLSRYGVLLIPEQIRNSNKSIENPEYPQPQIIEDGDTIVMDMLVNPKTKRTISDHITISSHEIPYGINAYPVPPRDFNQHERSLTATNPVLSIRRYEVFRTEGLITGRMLWIFMPGKGRYVLSITPRKGYAFEKAGFIQGHLLSFSLNGEQIELRSSFPILDNSGNWNLYVLRQPSYRLETGNNYVISVGAINQIE